MDDQFDNELKNRISKMFDTFEHQAVDKGWQRLQDQLPEEGNNRGRNWLWAGIAAAVVLLAFWGVNIMLNHPCGDTKRLSQKATKQYDHQSKTDVQHKQDTVFDKSVNQTAVAKIAKADTSLPEVAKKTTAKNQPLKNRELQTRSNNTIVKTRSIKSRLPKLQTGTTDTKDQSASLTKNETATTTQTENTAGNSTPATHTDLAQSIANGEPATSAMNNHDTVTKTPTSTALKNPKVKPAESGRKNSKRIEFSAYASTYFNFAQGIGANLNAGAGLTVDIRLFKNLKLSTGLAIEQNKLNYGDQQPNLAGVINTGAALTFDFLRQTSGPTAGTTYSMVLTNYTAQLLALDVPLNLKYEFNSPRTYRYFSLGVSSGAFIHESYTYRYNYSSQAVQTSVVASGLNNFYFAKTLNVAFGLGYPIGKTKHLIVEPFLKYPLSDLGSEGIRFGASGVNLKLGF